MIKKCLPTVSEIFGDNQPKTVPEKLYIIMDYFNINALNAIHPDTIILLNFYIQLKSDKIQFLGTPQNERAQYYAHVKNNARAKTGKFQKTTTMLERISQETQRLQKYETYIIRELNNTDIQYNYTGSLHEYHIEHLLNGTPITQHK